MFVAFIIWVFAKIIDMTDGKSLRKKAKN